MTGTYLTKNMQGCDPITPDTSPPGPFLNLFLISGPFWLVIVLFELYPDAGIMGL